MLATLYMHVHFSRYGVWLVLPSLAAPGVMAALWHGARTRRWQAYALAGMVTGLGLTTYQSFRLFPLALSVIGVALLVARWQERRQLFLGGLLAGGVSLIVFAPLGLFYLQPPAWFLNRFGQTTAATLGAADSLKILWFNALKVAGGLFWRGDASRLYNLPLRPVLDPIQALFFAVGLGACLRRPRQPETWALVAWAAIGLLPSVLTEDAPRFARITMAAPALVLIEAQGVLALWHGTIARGLLRGLVVAALALSTVVTIRDYFITRAEDPRTYSAFNGEELALALALRDAPPGATLYAAPLQRDYYQNYETGQRFGPADGFNSYDRGYWSIEYLLGPEAFSRTSMFNARECLVLPAVTTASTRYAVISEQPPQTLPALEAAFPAGERGVSPAAGEQSHVETFQILPGQTARIVPATEKQADFGGVVGLVGYTLKTQALKRGETIALDLVWKVETRTQTPYKMFLHVFGPPKDEGEDFYAQRDPEPCLNSYPTWQWRPGERVLEFARVALPDDIPAGSYTVYVGWYEVGPAGARLPISDPSGQPIGDSLQLTDIVIEE